jgi:polysaccharide export outer membrane protein
MTQHNGPCWHRLTHLGLLALGLSLLAFTAGCESPAVSAPLPGGAKQAEVFTLGEGDVLKISFPGAPNLDSTQTVRRDGKITLAVVGEISVIGRTPTELEQELLKLYSTQLVSKEVTVMVVSSSYAVFVSGSVLRPGKIMADRPLTALEAIMEAGGFDSAKADMSAVKVVRQEEGGTKNYVLNLRLILDGKSSEPFYLKRSDIVYVPEKFSWF